MNKRISFIVRWAPLFFLAATAWAILSWRHKPLSIGYVLACVAVGLFCGALIIFDYLRNPSFLVLMLSLMVFIAAPLFLNAFFFSDFEGGPGRAMSYQYMSVVMASILGVVVIFRGRLIKRTQADDAEQLVGPERR